MRISASRNVTPRGFTLLEMLVVMVIILILMALLLPAILSVRKKGDDSRNISDIMQLEGAIQQFSKKYGFYPPSRFVLRDFPATGIPAYGATAIETESFKCLMDMFPRIGNVGGAAVNSVDWNNNGVLTDGITLYGDQCLVFFLGGPTASAASYAQAGDPLLDALSIPLAFHAVAAVQSTPLYANGFNQNPFNPATPGGTRIPPWFAFKGSRLMNFRNAAVNYPSYLDTYERLPYAYFSAYNKLNGYNRYTSSDCPNVGSTVFPWPYAESAGVYLKPNSCQIISAGKDILFGVGSPNGTSGFWSLGGGSTPNAEDDQCNFTPNGRLGKQ